MNAGRAAFSAADVQAPGIQLDLMSLRVAALESPKTVPVGDEDHSGVAMPVPARLTGRGHQLFDLIGGQIFPGARN
jgi:hypothetical protein